MSDGSVDGQPAETRSAAQSARLEARQALSRRRRVMAALLLLAAVAAGAALGAAGTILYFRDRNFRPPPSPDSIGKAMLRRMDESLVLTGEEKEAVQRVVDRHMERAGDIISDSFADMRSEFEAMHAEVGDVLGPERFAVWDGLERERWRRLREKGAFRGRGHGHGGRRKGMENRH
ncbi:MAG: hypothetical protein LBU23_04220 [Planctomycetota bacterium]|jgi:hypothetical protein|nr:hypothetical protein [Planctomycetota bacterium]